MFVFRVLNTVPYTNRTGAKDLVASIHSFLTSNLLVGLAVLISWKQFGGTPIECMVPLDFTSAWVQYSNNYCWAQPTYFIPFTEELVEQVVDPADVVADGITIGNGGNRPRFVKKGGEKISYYQWMSFFLLFEAACFRLPCFIWKYFASQSGMQVGEILRVASDENNAVPLVKKANIDALCIHLRGVLRFQKRLKLKKIVPHKILRFLNIKYSAYYVTFIYFVAKVAFLLNVILQSKLLNKYMLPHDRQQNFGFDMWKTIFYGSTNGNETWRENGVFPRVTLCDFETRDMGNVQMHTVQCVLLLNLFTEKIFVFLWAWYILLTAFTVGNLFSWLFAVFNETYNEHFILNHLEMCETPFDKDDLKNREHVTRFITLYLGTDGLFLLQLIAQHADVVFTTELIAALFKTYIEIEAQRATLKQMNAVLPLLRPNDESQVESGKNTAPSTSHNVRRRGTEQLEKNVKSRQGSLSTQLRPFNSFEEPDQPTKKFDDSSSEDENSKKGSKKPSPTKKKASSKNSPQSSSNSRRPSLAHTASPAFTHHHEPDSKIPKTAEKKHW
ncbi:Innexin-7 [Caenorhabditis elegans]|uniref:Innexin-7 n=2 Tax=Caenorhabditis elegans TaxID=6239 RepID=INX7_CAEEL|nr:Innexin-7 [Caenorhabditis elegans]Q21123.1 RecName: Full=Innexin-7; AltName: Full=Protein opu-7 [Caenorhabditis elegans]CCD61803.1 Innexin-7 [Caenorhabditis elegans]|eukprot:NP_500894.1 Innexin-7 [Caenorhabditis elegans]